MKYAVYWVVFGFRFAHCHCLLCADPTNCQLWNIILSTVTQHRTKLHCFLIAHIIFVPKIIGSSWPLSSVSPLWTRQTTDVCSALDCQPWTILNLSACTFRAQSVNCYLKMRRCETGRQNRGQQADGNTWYGKKGLVEHAFPCLHAMHSNTTINFTKRSVENKKTQSFIIPRCNLEKVDVAQEHAPETVAICGYRLSWYAVISSN